MVFSKNVFFILNKLSYLRLRNKLYLFCVFIVILKCFASILIYVLLFLALQPSAGYGLVHEVFVITNNDAPQSVGLIWTSDQPVAETSTWQHTQQTNIHVHGEIRTHDRS
jgi:hypothetical protein